MNEISFAKDLNNSVNFRNLLMEHMTPEVKNRFERNIEISLEAERIYNDLLNSKILDYMASFGHKDFVDVVSIYDYNEEDIRFFREKFELDCGADGFKVESSATKENDCIWFVKFKISWDLDSLDSPLGS